MVLFFSEDGMIVA